MHIARCADLQGHITLEICPKISMKILVFYSVLLTAKQISRLLIH